MYIQPQEETSGLSRMHYPLKRGTNGTVGIMLNQKTGKTITTPYSAVHGKLLNLEVWG